MADAKAVGESGKTKLPHWDLSNVYAGLEAADFQADFERLRGQLDALETFLHDHGIERLASLPADLTAAGVALDELIGRLNETLKLAETIEAYVYAFVTTDSYDTVASRRMSEVEQLLVRLRKAHTRFQAWVGSLGPALPQICERAPLAREHRAVLDDLVEQSRYLMATQLEDLAAELHLSGGGAMWKLQGTVTSQLKVPFTRDGQTENLPITVIRNLAYDPDEDVRRRAYETELRACLLDSPETPAFHAMMQYPFGWVDRNLKPETAPSGKGVRPTICLLACQAAGGEYNQALPAAAALEIIHNFSLVHDDIQDRSPERRGRPS